MFPSRYTIFEPITVGVSSAAEAVLTSKRTDINDVISVTHTAADVLSLSSNFEVGKSFTAAKAVIADSTTPTLTFTKKGTTPFSTSISNNGSRLVFEHAPLFGVNEPYHTGNKPTLLELGAAAHLSCHISDAVHWLQDTLGRPDAVMPEEALLIRQKIIRPLPATPEPLTFSDSNYWGTERLIPSDVQATFSVGTLGNLPGCYYYNPQGEIVATGTRNPNLPENTKVTIMDGSKWQNGRASRDVLFGETQALSLKQPYLVLTEGIVDAIRCWQAGVAAVAMSSPKLTLAQGLRLAFLRSEFERVILCPDGDNAGKLLEGSNATKTMVKPFFKVSTWVLALKDAALYSPTELRLAFNQAFPEYTLQNS